MMRREWAIMAIDSSTLAIDLNGSLFVCLFETRNETRKERNEGRKREREKRKRSEWGARESDNSID